MGLGFWREVSKMLVRPLCERQLSGKSQTRAKDKRSFDKAETRALREKILGTPHGLLLGSQCEFARVILRKQVGCSGASVKEQALSDLTGSILATFPRMSNIFLHFRQVIDSKPQKDERRKESYGTIAQLTLLSC